MKKWLKLTITKLTSGTPRYIDVFRSAVVVSDIFICEGKDTFVALNCVTTLVFTEDIDRGITIKTRIDGDQTRRSQGQAFFFRETSIIHLQEMLS